MLDYRHGDTGSAELENEDNKDYPPDDNGDK
jgi:hypothetical protein